MDDGKLLQYGPPAEILARPATDFVERLVGTGERPFRLLSLMDLKTVLQPGDAGGATMPVTASQRDALAELLWSGRKALPFLTMMADHLDKSRSTGFCIRQSVRHEIVPVPCSACAASGRSVAVLWQPHLFEPLFRPLVDEGVPVIYDRANFVTLTLQHLGLVALAALASTIVAVSMAIFVTRKQGAEFLPLSRSLVNIGQTFPSCSAGTCSAGLRFRRQTDPDCPLPLWSASDF